MCTCLACALDMPVKDPIPCKYILGDSEKQEDGEFVLSVDEKANIYLAVHCGARVLKVSLPAKKQTELKKICTKSHIWLRTASKAKSDDYIVYLEKFTDKQGRSLEIFATSSSGEYTHNNLVFNIAEDPNEKSLQVLAGLDIDGIKKFENHLSALSETYKKLRAIQKEVKKEVSGQQVEEKET